MRHAPCCVTWLLLAMQLLLVLVSRSLSNGPQRGAKKLETLAFKTTHRDPLSMDFV
jgi:hypothetical protein